MPKIKCSGELEADLFQYFLTYHGSAEAASISIDKQVYDLEIIEQLSCPGKLDKNLRAIIACFPLQFDNLGDKYNPTNVMRDVSKTIKVTRM